MNTDHLHLRPLALAFLILGLLQLAPVFCRGQALNLRVIDCKDANDAWNQASALRATVPAIPRNLNVAQVFKHGTSPSMLPVFSGGHHISVIEGLPFVQVRHDDVVVFLSNRTAREIAEWGHSNGYVMHPCTGRTKDLIFTCGIDSIANPRPTADHPTDRAHYVGVVRQTFHY